MSRTTMDTTTTTVIRKIIGIISISTLFLSTRLQRRPPGEREDDFEDGDKDQMNMGTMTNVRIARLQAKPNPIDGALRLHAAGRSVRWGEYFLYSLEKFVYVLSTAILFII